MKRSNKGKVEAADRRKTLLVARESATGSEAKVLLAHLFTTLAKGVSDIQLPDFSDVIEVYENPGDFSAREIPMRDGRAVLVESEECDILLSLGSARKLNAEGDNVFVNILTDVIDSGCYRRLITTTISRLCRNSSAAGKLQRVMSDQRVTLQAGDTAIRVWKPSDRVLWSLMAWFAEFEAFQIEARLIAGKIARLEAGEWTFGFRPPPGWMLDEGNRVVLDEEMAEVVRFVISRICAGEKNFSQLARHIAEAWPELPARRGKTADWAENGGARVQRTLLNPRWFSAYTAFEVELEFVPNEVRRAMERGVAVGPDEIVRVRHKLPPHPRPLATTSQIEKVQHVLAEVSEASSSRQRPGSVFGSGLGWDESTVELQGI